MQLKGLVRFFAIALILICLYQLSFTWIVRNHESNMEAKADIWMKQFASPEQKYPSNKEQQSVYTDSLKELKKERLTRLLDSTKDVSLAFGFTNYRSAKEKELLLGLDLQGGMSVTMEVGLSDLLKSLANYTKDPVFTKALDKAVVRKANSGADLISLFKEELLLANPQAKLAPYFATRSNGKVKFDDSDSKVTEYLREQATSAFNNTYRILRTRIDQFGVSSPNINPDPAKSIINIELAGINDKERVRKYLQATANLQFFEMYTLESKDVQSGIVAADKAAQEYLNGIKSTDTVSAKADTTKKTAIVAAKTADTSKTATISNIAADTKSATAKKDTTKAKLNESPIVRLIQFAQPYQGRGGKTIFPSNLGYIQTFVIYNYIN